jgi:uncharacterized protein (DUF2345 family)
MGSPGSGNPGTIVSPTEPKEAKDADDANPGQVEEVKASQRQTQSGKYGSVPVKPFKAASAEQAEGAENGQKKKLSWVALKLEDEDGRPVAGEPYEVTLPDGSVASGTTDEKGQARVEGFEPGQCKVSFPKLDKSVVEEK